VLLEAIWPQELVLLEAILFKRWPYFGQSKRILGDICVYLGLPECL